MIIFVCGTSSVGKSKVCHNLKKSLPAHWLSFSMDGYLGMLGDKFLELHPNNPEVTTPNEVCYAHQHEDGTYEIVPDRITMNFSIDKNFFNAVAIISVLK